MSRKNPAKWTKAYKRLHSEPVAPKKKRILKDTPEYKAFRLSVLDRDNSTCVCCGCAGGYLEVHHVKPKKKYPDLIFETDNGVTLCLDCHYDKHPEKPRHRPWIN